MTEEPFTLTQLKGPPVSEPRLAADRLSQATRISVL